MFNGFPMDSEDSAMIVICDEMKWTYDQYLNQPTWFINGLTLLWNARARKQKNG